MIDIHDHQCSEPAALVPFTLNQHFFYPLLKAAPIRQTGQIIMVSQIINPGLGLLIFLKRLFNGKPVYALQQKIISYTAAKHSEQIIHLSHA
ncbi:hypothetical protein D3C75_745320 [compost metagenome]